MGRLDRRLPSESPVQAIDGLDDRPMARCVRVVVHWAGRCAEERSAGQVEGCVMLRKAAGGLEPQVSRGALGLRAKAFEHMRWRPVGDASGTCPGVGVELSSDRGALSHEPWPPLVERGSPPQLPDGLPLVPRQSREFGPGPVDRAWQPLELAARAIELDPVTATQDRTIEVLDGPPHAVEPRLHVFNRRASDSRSCAIDATCRCTMPRPTGARARVRPISASRSSSRRSVAGSSRGSWTEPPPSAPDAGAGGCSSDRTATAGRSIHVRLRHSAMTSAGVSSPRMTTKASFDSRPLVIGT
jgi:hypothetical protein